MADNFFLCGKINFGPVKGPRVVCGNYNTTSYI